MPRLKVYLLLGLLALPALWPLLQPDIPRTNDALTHLYRAVALDAALRGGTVYPRWSPDLVHGYGYPVFDLFTPIPHYLVVLIHRLGLDLLAAYKVASALAFLLAGWFAWELGRELLEERAGLLAGVIYLYSPFLLYDAHIRGSLPESLALGVLPLVFLFLRRVARGERRAVAPAALSLAAFVLLHHGVALQTMPLLGAWGLFHLLRGAPRPWQARALRRPFSLLASSFLLALLLSAFFWLPALVESRYAQTWRGTNNAGMDYAFNFFPAADFLRWPRLPLDPDLLNPPLARSLPQLALLAALLLPLAWRRLAPETRQEAAFVLLAGAAFFWLMTPPAKPLWDALPLLRLTLFPWRLLGPLSLLAALLAATALSSWVYPAAWGAEGRPDGGGGARGGGRPHGVAPTALLIFALAAFPWTYPPREPAPPAPTLVDVAAFEIPPAFVGTTTVGEYLPIWAEQLPDTRAQQAELLAGRDPDRLDRAALPPTVAADLAGRLPLRWTYRLDAAAPAALTFRQFYFPGWRATLDGAPLPIRVTYPEGLMRVQVPAGRHTLVLRFGSTPVRVAALLLSAFAGLSLAAMGWASVWAGRGGRLRGGGQPDGGGRAGGGGRPHGVAPTSYFLLPLLLLGIRLLLVDSGRTPLLRHQLSEAGLTGVAHPLNEGVAGELRLLGWEASTESPGADEAFVFTVYWTPQHRLGIPYGFKVELVDADGTVWSHGDPPRPNHWRFTPGTDFWPVGQYILDPYVITPLTGTPPGEYRVRVTAFSRVDLQAVHTAALGPIIVSRPSALAPDPSYRRLSDSLALAAFSPDRTEAAPGETVGVSILLRAEGDPVGAQEVPLELVNGRAGVVAAQQIQVGEWPGGSGVRVQLGFLLPASLQSGEYVWRSGGEEMGRLHVIAPERTFTAPPMGQRIEARLGPVTLVGATLEGARVTLVWRAEAEMAVSYRVFLHALDASGELVGQSDGIPAGWSRPTSGWLPGEYVTDARTLTLPPGSYTLFAGMYDPATGERLTSAAHPDGRVKPGEVKVEP